MNLISSQNLQYFLEIDYSPNVAAVIQVFILTNLPTVPSHYFAGYETQLNEAISKGYVKRLQDDSIGLTVRSTDVLKTILFLAEEGV